MKRREQASPAWAEVAEASASGCALTVLSSVRVATAHGEGRSGSSMRPTKSPGSRMPRICRRLSASRRYRHAQPATIKRGGYCTPAAQRSSCDEWWRAPERPCRTLISASDKDANTKKRRVNEAASKDEPSTLAGNGMALPLLPTAASLYEPQSIHHRAGHDQSGNCHGPVPGVPGRQGEHEREGGE